MSSAKEKCLLFGLKSVLHARGPPGVWGKLSLVLGQHRDEVIASILCVGLGTNVGRNQGIAETLTFSRD